MTQQPYLGIDLGALTLRVATEHGVTPVPAPAGGPADAARAALAAAGERGTICLAVPDSWLSGDRSGAARQEEARHECEDVARTGRVRWAGQLAAVCAYAATTSGPGRYLVCDVGGTGVRAGMFTVAGGTIQIEAARAEPGGGWRDFDEMIRARLPAARGTRLPDTWHERIPASAARATVVLEAALTSGYADDLDARVYRIAGAGGDVDLTARIVIDSFEPTERRLRTAIPAVLGDTRPGHVVISGGLGRLPLAARTAVLAAGAAVAGNGSMTVPGDAARVVSLDAAARGALILARGDISLALPAGSGAVAVPVHRIHEGFLEEVSVTLPWAESFATFPGGLLTIDSEELEVTVAGQPRVARLPGLAPGPHLVGLRPSWPGPGVLVVRPVGGGTPHIIPLAGLAAR